MNTLFPTRNTYAIVIFLVILFGLFSCQSTDNTLPGFEIHPDFKLKLVASEPLIYDPVDFKFDENGLAYVLEMPGYPFEDTHSRIAVLTDSDSDGTYDKRIVFAENVQLASSILPFDNGILIAAPPYLLHVKDLDGDHFADVRDTLMTGFSTGNLQHNYNGLTYGMDNWIYAGNGGNSGNPSWYVDPASEIDLRGDDLRINIKKRKLERVGASTGGYGLGIDEWGRLYGTHNLEHLSQLVFPGRYAASTRLTPQNALTNISDHEENGLARIYPIGAQESRVNHPEQSGYFSGSCGINYYGGGALGAEFDNTIWVADVVLNLIHVDKLSPNGSMSKASRILEKSDFLASTDRSFRPVNMSVGPNGELYVIDMYREVIEHPEWIPDDIEKTLDLEAGKEKGRIYKITKKGEKKETFDWNRFDTSDGLISCLKSSNQWIRNTAHRIILEKDLSDSDLVMLTEMIKSTTPLPKTHALWILHSSGKLSKSQLVKILDSDADGVVENALIIAESYLDKSPEVIKRCINLLSNNNQRVRMQAALSLSTISDTKLRIHVSEIMKRMSDATDMPMDQWNIAAITILANRNIPQVFSLVLEENENEENENLPISLANASGGSQVDAIAILRTISNSSKTDQFKSKIVKALTQNLNVNLKSNNILPYLTKLEERSEIDLIAATAELRNKLNLPTSKNYIRNSQAALQLVKNHTLDTKSRLQQLALIELLPYANKAETLYSLLSNTENLSIQDAALKQLNTAKSQDIGERLVSLWPNLGPQSRRSASDILLYNEKYHDALLTGLETNKINIGEMNFDLERRRTLLWWTDNEDTKRRAEALFSDSGVVNRKDVLDQMKPALALTGSTSDGANVFNQICGQCHVYGTQGNHVGPVLTEINRKSKETLLHDILDPNAAVDTKYINHKLISNDGAIHIGIVDNESDRDITIMKMGGDKITIPKTEIESLTSLGTSMMMEGLEANMSHQDMSDLLAFLQQSN